MFLIETRFFAIAVNSLNFVECLLFVDRTNHPFGKCWRTLSGGPLFRIPKARSNKGLGAMHKGFFNFYY